MSEVLVLAHATDAGAVSVAAALRARLGADAVRVVRPEALGVATWSHRVDSRGRASTRVSVPGMAPLDSAMIGAVLNRIRFIPMPRFRRSSRKDQDYAGSEMQALVASWLAALGDRVIHDVRRHPWVTPFIHRHAWVAAAAACALPVAFTRTATPSHAQAPTALDVVSEDDAAQGDACSERAVLVAGDEAEGPLAGRFGNACLAAARRLGYALLEFRFVDTDGRLCLCAVDPLPALDRSHAVAAACRLVASRLSFQRI